MFDNILKLLSTTFGIVIAGAIILMLILGTVGPAWEGTKSERNNFWYVFLPSLILLLIVVFYIGKNFG